MEEEEEELYYTHQLNEITGSSFATVLFLKETQEPKREIKIMGGLPVPLLALLAGGKLPSSPFAIERDLGITIMEAKPTGQGEIAMPACWLAAC